MLRCLSYVSISDHSPIYAFRKHSVGTLTRNHSTINYRKFKNFDSIKFRNDINKLHMQSAEEMLAWMFAYDRPSYSRFQTYYMVSMQKLPETLPSIHEQFEAGNVSVRRQPGKFNKIPSDQAIEQTINRDQKCPGGIIGFSTSEGTVQRRSLTSHVAAKSQSQLEEFFGMTDDKCVTKDLAQNRISFDEECTIQAKQQTHTLVLWFGV